MYSLWKEKGKPRTLPSGLPQWSPQGPVTLKAPKLLHPRKGRRRLAVLTFISHSQAILSTVFWGSKDLEMLSQVLKMGRGSAFAGKVLQP